ncbi:MAG: PD-(D/E)XK motif protein [Methylophilaceae bacterium]
MPESSPWDEIGVPISDFNVKRIAGNMAVPCYWGRNRFGLCLFILDLDGDLAENFRNNNVQMNGVEVDLRTDGSQQRLLLTLEKQADRDLFEGFCRTLAKALEYANDSASSLNIALAHIRRWKVFMSGRSQHLSAEEVRGLFAELIFLGELVNQLGAKAAVEAWKGPERSHQDFIFGNAAVEIKSLSGAERNSIRISSEDQLESLNDNLFLRIYRLSDLPDVASAHSLNELIAEIQDKLDFSEAVEAFNDKLAAHAYVPLPEYDAPKYVVSEIQSYRVEGDFPRVIRARLPAGISNVSYDIRIESITVFGCNEVLRAK